MIPTIVLFDGVCNLCNSTVDLLIRIDRKNCLQFGSLQGEAARKLIGNLADLDSIVVVVDRSIFRESDAIIQIGLSLGGIFRILAMIFRLIPRPVRDLFYRGVAIRRYRLFGRRNTCRVPSESERKRFIDRL